MTSLGRHVRGMTEISKARRTETIGFLPLYLWKVVAGLALNPKEGSLRTVYRIFMLFLLPGKSLEASTYYKIVHSSPRKLKKSKILSMLLRRPMHNHICYLSFLRSVDLYCSFAAHRQE